MPDTELAKRLTALATAVAAAMKSGGRTQFVATQSAHDCLTEAAAALSAARAEAMREAAEKVRRMGRHYEQYLQKYPDEQISDVRAALCGSLAKQLDALAGGQGGETQ